jgi:hypothetical protein
MADRRDRQKRDNERTIRRDVESFVKAATAEAIRKHDERMDRMAIAKRCVLMRLQADGSGTAADPTALIFARILRAAEITALDGDDNLPQTIGA